MTTDATLSLIELFSGLDAQHFVVMKSLPEAEPKPGSDIDLLCDDAVALGRLLVRNARPMIEQGYEIRITAVPETSQTHIDLMQGDMLRLRLDLHEGLGCYPGIPIRETYAKRLLDNKQQATLQTPSGVLNLPVPSPVDNLVLRYLEYHAFFDARPDKVKHADHIAAHWTVDPTMRDAFFDRLSQAMAIRPAQPFIKHCDFNAKRQVTWAYWSLHDKLAWRLAWAKQVLTLAASEPRVFARKLKNKLLPGHAKPHAFHTEAH